MNQREGSQQRADVLDTPEIDASAISQIVIGLEGGERENLSAKQGGEFRSYELYEASNYIRNLSKQILKG